MKTISILALTSLALLGCSAEKGENDPYQSVTPLTEQSLLASALDPDLPFVWSAIYNVGSVSSMALWSGYVSFSDEERQHMQTFELRAGAENCVWRDIEDDEIHGELAESTVRENTALDLSIFSKIHETPKALDLGEEVEVSSNTLSTFSLERDMDELSDGFFSYKGLIGETLQTVTIKLNGELSGIQAVTPDFLDFSPVASNDEGALKLTWSPDTTFPYLTLTFTTYANSVGKSVNCTSIENDGYFELPTEFSQAIVNSEQSLAFFGATGISVERLEKANLLIYHISMESFTRLIDQ